MKKTLALVLALLMVLALVPTAFAKVTYTTNDNYKVKVEVTKESIGSIEFDKYLDFTDEDTGKSPAVSLELPIDSIAEVDDPKDLWDDGYPDVKFTITGFDNDFNGDGTWGYGADVKATVNGDEVTYSKDWTSWADRRGTVTFTMSNLTPANATYDFEVVVTGKNAAGDTLTETMTFTFQYRDTTKPVYDLKFGQPDTTGVELKDGVYFIDSASNNPSTVDRATINVLKNDGSKFTERAYYEDNEATGGYPVANEGKPMSDSQVVISTANAKEKPNNAYTYKVTVETKYAIYQGEITFKYRTNVQRVDPKGVFFAKDEYTIGVNEVLEPTYTTTVPVWHDVASRITLTQSANTEKGIVDCDGNKITGLREGTAYVVLNYRDVFVRADGAEGNWVYTDTVKVTVKGTYQVTDKANYIVTTSSSSLNVRSGAGTKYSKIGSLAKGTVVEVVEIKDGWAKIIFPSARYTNGYVSAQYLTKQSTSPETVIGEKTVIARVLNVRSGAGTSYSIVGKLNRNTKVEVIETVANGSWSKIKFNGGYAYVSSTYIQ